MRANFQLASVDAIEATLSITMTVANWKALRKAMDNQKWPESEIVSAIGDLVGAAEKHFYRFESGGHTT